MSSFTNFLLTYNKLKIKASYMIFRRLPNNRALYSLIIRLACRYISVLTTMRATFTSPFATFKSKARLPYQR